MHLETAMARDLGRSHVGDRNAGLFAGSSSLGLFCGVRFRTIDAVRHLSVLHLLFQGVRACGEKDVDLGDSDVAFVLSFAGINVLCPGMDCLFVHLTIKNHLTTEQKRI